MAWTRYAIKDCLARELSRHKTMPIAFPPVPMYVAPLLSGDAGVEQTIDQMRGLVDQALRDPSIIRQATDIVRGVSAFDDLGEANAIYEWVRGNIRFTKDPVNKEKLYPPAELLDIRAGDCDDISMLTAALVMAIGYPARFVTVAASQTDPDQFSHVYTEAEVPAGSGEWIPLDSARYDSQFGVAPPVVTRSRWWSLIDSSYGDLSGCGCHSGSSVRAGVSGTPLSGLGNYPRFRSHMLSGGAPPNWFNNRAFGPWRSFQTPHSPGGLASYSRARTMGDVSPTDVSLVTATGQSVSDIILASQGVQQYQPYPTAAGYTTQVPGVALPGSSNTMMWALLLLGVFALAEKR
jgi:hypothetical protein